MNSINHDGVFNSTTTWSLAGGALTDSISFECSSTTPANHDSENEIIPAAVDHVEKSPLLLIPPIPNGDPCEITLTFSQEYELRQIYIRSTARVYEVYYTKKPRHDKEYLCTVRCGFAMRVEEVLQISLTESAALKGVEAVKDPMEKMVKGNGNGRMNEDDWFEVKAGDDSLLPMSQLGKQDLFEATAEINDAEPCTSITLRLLSLQDKGCAIVDEVYVFADPVDPSESEQDGAGNSSSSSLMAMFMPTILQLARGKDLRKERDIQVSDKSNSTNPGTLGNSTYSDQIVNEIRQETNCSKADHIRASSPVLVDTLVKRVDAATPVSGAEIKPATSCNNVETILDQLVNKVSRIETMLTRFEDQILKPINSIDARLQLVEKKLEQLGKKSFESELVLEKNIHSPVSPGSDADKTSDTNELDGLTKYTDDPHLAPSTNEVVPKSSSMNISEDSAVVLPQDRVDTILTNPEELGSENTSISGNEMISAESEISDEEVSHSLRKGSFKVNPKPSLSINDALASALTGLLSSHLMSQAKAPEYSDQDDSEVEAKLRTDAHPDISQVVAEELGNSEAEELGNSEAEKPTSSQKELQSVPCIEDDSKEMVCGVREKLDNIFGGDDDAEIVGSVKDDALDEETVASSTHANSNREMENLSDEPANLDSLVHNLEKPNATTKYESSRCITSKECKVEPEMDDVLKSVLGFEPTTSPLDFLSPVLDVKFSSDKQNSDGKSFFEELFTAESKTVVDCNNEACDDNLVSVKDEEGKDPPRDTLSSVEMDHYETNEMALNLNIELSSTSLI